MDIKRIIGIIRETDDIFFNEKLRSDFSEKGASDYVTRADIEISRFLNDRLKEEFPEVGFISEEEPSENTDGDYWVLDPIDGTTNFMHGFDCSAVSLGYCSGGEVISGVIYQPFANEMYWAEKGKGAFMNGRPISCSSQARLSESLGMMEYNAYFKNLCGEALEQARRIYMACRDIRTLGSAAVELAYIACGRADVFLGRYLKPWDYAAGSIIIKEAGGMLTDMDGKVPVTEMNCHILATNGIVHDQFMELLK